MRQAILITAYKNENQIIDIINYFGKDFNFYIHVDKKSPMNLSKTIREDNIHIYKKYIVNWGSVNHLKAILFLSKEALENKQNEYFHLITGQDFPIKTKKYFTYELNKEKDYLTYFEMPANCWVNGGMDRVEYYNFYEYFNVKNLAGRFILKCILKIQKVFKIKRKKTLFNYFEKVYGGSTYWTLTKESLQYVLELTNRKPEVLKTMKFTICAEEIYFQTILVNSKQIKNIANNNLRYIDWNTESGASPAFLDETDFEKIIRTENIFARKFHEKSSEKLKKLLMEHLKIVS